MATLQMWCDARGLACEGVPVGTIKKFATGRGNATKQGMVAAMRERGHRPKDHNEADALALLFWRLEQTRPGQTSLGQTGIGQTRLEQARLEAANRNAAVKGGAE